MGKVMKAVMARLAGLSVDGRAVSDAVKKRLSWLPVFSKSARKLFSRAPV